MPTRPDPSPAPARPRDRLRASVQLLFAGVFVTLVAVLVAGLWLHRQETIESGQSRAANLALILGEHFSRSISAIDTTLHQLALSSNRLGGPSAPQEAWAPVLQSTQAALAGIGSLTVTDANGIITHATLPILIGQSRADQYLFRKLASSASNEIEVDTRFRSLVSRGWFIPFGRRLTNPDGSFAGVIVATFEPERLRGFYRSVDVGREGFLWILHASGQVLLREPHDPAAEQRAPANPLLAEPADRIAGTLQRPLEPGGPAYVTAYRRIATPPVTIAVSLSERDVLAEWRSDALISTSVVAVAGILLMMAGAWISREIAARIGAEARAVTHEEALVAAVGARDEAGAALRKSQTQFQAIMDHAPMMVSLKDRTGRYTFVNRAFHRFAVNDSEELIGKTVADYTDPEFAKLIESEDRTVIETRQAMQREFTGPSNTGQRTTLLVKFPVFDDSGEVTAIGTMMTDITEQKSIEEQLAQSQRMEAVGQLTGGVAHDFNNLLTAILLNADVLTTLLQQNNARSLAEAIRMAAERGADLTRRLLAFGRRQVLEPQPTCVKGLLTAMGPLMHRTLGEHIEIRFVHGTGLWPASVDPGQLENAVLNLAVNARDAMPHGGRLTIETANVTLDDSYGITHPDVKPADYVMVAVRDTGSGMAPEVVARAFEPFFTTKEVGKGTGLGLSMVYGFVKQSGGHVRIYSEVGTGTVVRVYLPRSDTPADEVEIAGHSAVEMPTGTETILFVEDDPLVRTHTGGQLVELGYNVVTAEDAAAAIAHVEAGCVPDLLFTDVVMPGGVNGRQLAQKLRQRWPSLRVLYTSGYAHGTLTGVDSELVPARLMLGKPYGRRALAAKLREVLDEQSGTPRDPQRGAA